MYRKHSPANRDCSVCQKRDIFSSQYFYLFTTNLIQSYLLSPTPFFLRSSVHSEVGIVYQVRIFKSWIRINIICSVQDHMMQAGFWNAVCTVSLVQTLFRRMESLLEQQLTTPTGAASATSNTNWASFWMKYNGSNYVFSYL